MKTEEIQHLATLARIRLTDTEADALAHEFDAILGYVAQVTEISADVSSEKEVGVHAQVMRADEPSHEPGAYTEVLLNAAPERAGAYVQVKKILGNNDAG